MVSRSSLQLREEDDDTGDDYTVRLDFRPSGNVRIDISNDGNLNISPTRLTFTPSDYDIEKTVSVKPRQDDNGVHEQGIVISHVVSGASEYSGIGVQDVAVAVTDDDQFGMTIEPTEITLNEDNTSAMHYTVKLNTQPSASVMVAITKSGDPDNDVTVSRTSLTFTTTNWKSAQRVSVSTGQEEVPDQDMDNEEVFIDHVASSTDSDYDGVRGETVTVNVKDDDIPGVTVNPTSLTLTEGRSAGQYKVRLNALPTASVTINIVETDDSDDSITASPTSLTFTINDWNSEKTVRVTPDQDGNTVDETVTIEHNVDSSSAIEYRNNVSVDDVTVSVTDDDVPGCHDFAYVANCTGGWKRRVHGEVGYPAIRECYCHYLSTHRSAGCECGRD